MLLANIANLAFANPKWECIANVKCLGAEGGTREVRLGLTQVSPTLGLNMLKLRLTIKRLPR